MAGYSGTPLAKKLGIKTDHRLASLHAPGDFEELLGELPSGVSIQGSLRGKRNLDVIVLFVERRAILDKELKRVAARLEEAGGLWIAWPKKTSGVATDLDGGAVRAAGLGVGLVDNKVCAIDETWSGHRFVKRLADRR